MERLTGEELRRVHRSIRRQYPTDPNSNILAVGFGHAQKRGNRDSGRPFAACYYVRSKKKRVPVAERIPPEVTVRLRRGDHFVTLTLPTDVIPTPRFVPGGQFVTHNGGLQLGSAGVVIAWKSAGMPWKWGVVTAGHLFRNSSIDVALQPTLDGLAFPGTVIHSSSIGELLDAAIVEVDRGVLAAALLEVGIVLPSAPPPVGDFWNVVELAETLRTAEQAQAPLAGTSLRPEADEPGFQTVRYFPQSDDLIPALGNLSDIVHVKSTTPVAPAAFIQGTSGSAWFIGSRPAAIQVGHDLGTSTEGLGQFLDTQLVWARNRLEMSHGPLTFFRFVCTF